jgi:asparagine synthase (glutamine-hydrolysing)
MCGIAGIVAGDRLSVGEPARARLMAETLVHRGPDDHGMHCDAQACLTHRRLSIVDLATGRQPLSNEDGTIWVVYNGEIYNHAAVRADLVRSGHRYRTQSDTETIVHAYETWGDRCVRHLRGMFAFALWDAPRRRLLLARDRLGVKPLYWTLADGRLAFASEIKAVLASRLVAAQAREDLLPELLATRYISGPDTMVAGVSKLPPGHVLVFEDGRVTVSQYWDVPSRSPDPQAAGSPGDIVARFRALLEESVRLRLMSDVPLGIDRKSVV